MVLRRHRRHLRGASRTSSRTRARSWSRPARSRSPASRRGSSAAPRRRPHARRHRLRRQHELRPAALRRRARRAGRAARGDPRRDHPRAARAASASSARCSASAASPSSTTAIADARVAHLFVGIEVANRHETDATCSRDLQAPPDRGASTCPTTRWPSCTCATWSAGTRRRPTNEILYRFEFPERPGRADALPRQHERAAGTSACSTTATTAPTTAACWSACRCRRRDKARVPALSRPPWLRPASTRRTIRPTGCSSAGSARAAPRGRDPRDGETAGYAAPRQDSAARKLPRCCNFREFGAATPIPASFML